MKIGFLFNHDQIHQIAHSLPIALALFPDAEVVLATTRPALAREVRRIAALMGRPDIVPLSLDLTSAGSKLLECLFGQILPARRLLIYKDNLAFFRTLDALIVTERTSLILKTRLGLHSLPMILADHGAGDRAIGFGQVVSQFDHVLAAGPKIADRLTAEAGVRSDRISVTGYPKFDLVPRKRKNAPFAGSNRPTVVYNPHVSPHLSSWYGMGRAVLDFFLDNDDYNLIFAPHVMLFQRRWSFSVDRLRAARPGKLDDKYFRATNIHIDLGSLASTDMSYTNAADIYLGDVSSQIYEFLRRPRPAVFLNPHRVAYADDPNYTHWKTGPVIEGVEDLEHALSAAVQMHQPVFESIQRKLFDYTFDITNEPAGSRAARAILSLLDRNGRTTLQEAR